MDEAPSRPFASGGDAAGYAVGSVAGRCKHRLLDEAHRRLLNLFREKLMPVAGHDGKVILDYGCGPGNDLVNLVEFSKPKRLVGVDISPTALELSRIRLPLHDKESVVELVQIQNGAKRLPFDDATFDYVHCDGVIHHTPNPEEVLAEFKRVLRPGGEARIYAYHYDSIWLHYYVAFLTRVKQGRYRDVGIREAFRHCTDGPECPISNCYTADEFVDLCRSSGLQEAVFLGSGIVVDEMAWVQNRFEAIADERLEREHRTFLRGLTFDEHQIPHSKDVVAGSSAFYSYVKPAREGA
jgi:SAM-dependent methyltransferase